MADETANGAASAQQPTAQLVVQKIYVKDASFEAPNSPMIFQQEGQPNLQLNLSQKVATLNENLYEVVLSLTLTCTLAEKSAYLAEVQQAGIFGIVGFDQANLEAVLSTYCPNALFPYARQIISDLVQNGGFPPYLLQPINFEQLYAEQLRRRADQVSMPTTTLEAGNA
ncbi:MAG: protein-export chaperone SecB [Pseudomarimonas sp.]